MLKSRLMLAGLVVAAGLGVSACATDGYYGGGYYNNYYYRNGHYYRRPAGRYGQNNSRARASASRN